MARIKLDKLHSIIFSCDGNVCRSPMAEALLKQKLPQKGVSKVDIASCGLQVHRDSFDPNLAVLLGDAYENIRGTAPRQISEEIVRSADLILAMEQRQVRNILARFPLAEGKLATVNGFTGDEGEVRNFLGSGQGAFLDWMKDCLTTLQKNTDKIANEIEALLS